MLGDNYNYNFIRYFIFKILFTKTYANKSDCLKNKQIVIYLPNLFWFESFSFEEMKKSEIIKQKKWKDLSRNI